MPKEAPEKFFIRRGLKCFGAGWPSAVGPGRDQPRILEVELCSELNDARFVVSRKAAEGGAIYVGADGGEIGVVEGVKEFAAKLEADVFAKLYVLDCREIPIIQSGTQKHTSPLGAEMADSMGECGGIEEFGNRAGAGNRYAGNQIGPRRNGAGIDSDAAWINSWCAGGPIGGIKGILRLGYRERLTRLDSRNAGKLPASENMADDTLLGTEKRQFVDIVRHEDLRCIERSRTVA